MKKKIILSILLLGFIIFIPFTSPSQAIECGQDLPDDPEQLRQYVDSCENQIGQLQQEQNTLKAAINLLNSKINLPQAQIRSTAGQIGKLEEEIHL